MLTENGFLIQAYEKKSLVKYCLEFVLSLFKCSEAAFKTINGRETMERSASIHLAKRKVFMATIIGYVKTPQANFSDKGFYFVKQFENVCIPPCLGCHGTRFNS